jgi:hypothetical protein
VNLAQAIAGARALDMRADPGQETPTRRRLLPAIEAIMERLHAHRAAVDERFLAKRTGLESSSGATRGEATLAAYPIGYCGPIRDQVFARLRDDRVFHGLIGPDVVLKKVFVLLKGLYFQNALQLGNLYVDVANDTVFVEKPKVEWARIGNVDFENAESWPTVAAVGKRYHGIELYPNLLFPLAFPSSPYFAIRASGRIDFFQAQNVLFLKDLGDGMRRARALLDDPAFFARPLPEPYRRLVETACGGNLHTAFPLEYAPTDAEALRARVLPEFAALAAKGDAAAFATIESYNRLMEEATLRLARMNLRPEPGELADLRTAGAVPPEPVVSPAP